MSEPTHFLNSERVQRVIRWLVIGLCSATAAGYLGMLGAFPEMFSNFRPQYMFLLSAALLLLLFLKRFKLALIAGIFVLVNAASIAPIYSGEIGAGESGRYRAMTLNVYYQNENYSEVISLIRQTDPHFVMLFEVTPAWETALDSLHSTHHFSRVIAREGKSGIAFYSKLRESFIATHNFGDPERPGIIAKFLLEEQPLTIIGAHPESDRIGTAVASRKKQLEGLASYSKSLNNAVMVLADLNITPWSALFDDLVEVSGLSDARNGRGMLPTWPSPLQFAGIPIDHCLMSAEVRVNRLTVGPHVGSDHRPLLVEFSVEASDQPF